MKVRCDRSPVEGMMTEPLRSFCDSYPRSETSEPRRYTHEPIETKLEGERRPRRIGASAHWDVAGRSDSRFSWKAFAVAIGPPTPTGRSSSHVLCF